MGENTKLKDDIYQPLLLETFLQTPWELFLVQQWIFLSVLSHYPSAKEKKNEMNTFHYHYHYYYCIIRKYLTM